MNAYMVLAQIIPVLMLGIGADMRVALNLRSTARLGCLLFGAAALCGLMLEMLFVLPPLAVIPSGWAASENTVFVLAAVAMCLFALPTTAVTIASLRKRGQAHANASDPASP
ncbi:hypothetical protein L2X99_10645 [Microbacterium sp. KUDC0406]|uniref:hypothetical protein n=1 Tax=Microbacterium sp. KUDC0406 TaxID=2909588 RepID=UPI001F167B24|nr:hypothetical protein [Microbacterium sp. KUDC0406]UJP08938.1 hypothetical protein L2X99_10645 [Microbacterium sp. KUDC0406]